jgi:predicted Rossmann fold nucleotide-binding protein DprA/Smf involved in DNA uptake
LQNLSDRAELTKENLTALFVLDALKGFGPQKFKLLWDAKISPERVIKDATLLPLEGKTGDKLRAELSKMPDATLGDCAARAGRQLETAKKHGARILTYGDPDYPPNLLASPHPVADNLCARQPESSSGRQDRGVCRV